MATGVSSDPLAPIRSVVVENIHGFQHIFLILKKAKSWVFELFSLDM